METITSQATVTFTRDGQLGTGDSVWRGVVTGAPTIEDAFAALKGKISDLTPMGQLPADPFCAEVKALTETADGVWAFEIVRRWND